MGLVTPSPPSLGIHSSLPEMLPLGPSIFFPGYFLLIFPVSTEISPPPGNLSQHFSSIKLIFMIITNILILYICLGLNPNFAIYWLYYYEQMSYILCASSPHLP